MLYVYRFTRVEELLKGAELQLNSQSIVEDIRADTVRELIINCAAESSFCISCTMQLFVLLAVCIVLLVQPVCAFIQVASTVLRPIAVRASAAAPDRETDVVVIGSGIGGLSAATLSARYGLATEVFEAHYHPGGVAHAFEEKGFKFDAGNAALHPNSLQHCMQGSNWMRNFETEPACLTGARLQALRYGLECTNQARIR
jgi:NAD(P)-binding Rossmann-like domain